MTLADALRYVQRLQLSDEQTETIYAQRPWTAASAAFVVKQPTDGRLPEEAPAGGFIYFLEASIAQEFFGDWRSSFEEGCDRLIQYAEHDA